ncbi:hypothetical protein L207DRAFT_121738 [Hyaloscypha variabilis F]|uniref:Ankyrin n=1 Tax=Hyaloscypha variabilis (strain UAMH 11265 / GT02V1 / F) TaxID=1149755 RepID=A0A2J6R7N4_HYAVF|nr:hypothetical protein L207DRAFT_121738 [Hyaloscypha variabilis F]
MISWTTTTIADVTKHFVATGLGSALDASLCISAALSPYLCDDETTAYAILRTFVEYHKPNSLYDSTMYSGLTNGHFSDNPVDTCVLEADTTLGLYDDRTKLGLFEEYILICLFEYHRSQKNVDHVFYHDSSDWPIVREDCKEVCEITEKYKSVLTAEARNKKSGEWLEQFQKRDWSGLLGYLTWCEIDAEQMTKLVLSYRILEMKSCGAGQVALVLALLQSGLDPDKSLKGALEVFAKRGKTALLRLLLDFGARPDSGLVVDTPLVCAAGARHVAALDILLRAAKISPKINSIPHESLVRAIQIEQMAAVARLMEDPRIDVKEGLDPALEASHIGILKLFLKDSRITTTIESLLTSAAKISSSDVVKLLLADPRLDDLNATEAGFKALHIAVPRNRSTVVKVLLEDPHINPLKLGTISSSQRYAELFDMAEEYGQNLRIFRNIVLEGIRDGETGVAKTLRKRGCSGRA